jgi:glycosyltransferase involved in cell wall biosynthesis
MQGISVIIAAYNAEHFIKEAIDSALGQDYPGPLEVLVCDDGSKDATADIVSSYGPPVRLLRHSDNGNRSSAASRNLCIASSRHPVIAFLDADDVWLPDHLSRLVGALELSPNAVMAADCGKMILKDGREIGRKPHPSESGSLSASAVLLDVWFPSSAVVVYRKTLDSVGGFSEDLLSAEDQDLWLRILERWPGIYLTSIGYLYRLHSCQKTTSTRIWREAMKILDQARQRGHYPADVVRRRRAVIHYRLAQSAWVERRFGAWLAGLLRAALLDPRRAFAVFVGMEPRR